MGFGGSFWRSSCSWVLHSRFANFLSKTSQIVIDNKTRDESIKRDKFGLSGCERSRVLRKSGQEKIENSKREQGKEILYDRNPFYDTRLNLKKKFAFLNSRSLIFLSFSSFRVNIKIFDQRRC